MSTRQEPPRPKVAVDEARVAEIFAKALAVLRPPSGNDADTSTKIEHALATIVLAKFLAKSTVPRLMKALKANHVLSSQIGQTAAKWLAKIEQATGGTDA